MPPTPLVAMVALRDRGLPPESRVLEFLRASKREIPPVAIVDRRADRFTLAVGADTATISLEPAPIPWAELEGPCKSAWYWPEAAGSLRDHAAHVAVVLLPQGEDRITAALVLTNLVAAVAASANAAGVFWASGGLVHAPEAFISYCQEPGGEYLPLNLWIDFSLMRNDDGTCSLFTTGMEEFDLMEIEVHNSREEPELLLEGAFKMAHYLLENGPIVEDGETVELSDEEKCLVRFGPSMWDEHVQVIRLER